MKKVQIIADNMSMVSVLQGKLSRIGWPSESIDFHEMMKGHSTSASDYRCLIVVVDAGFLGRFGSLVEEMCAMIRNRSRRTSLYLMFENDHGSRFSSWLAHARRSFKTTSHPGHLLAALEDIIRLESTGGPRAAFMSPMDSF